MFDLPSFHHPFILLSLLIFFPCCLVTAQQPYASSTCGGRNSSSALGYDCNGVNTSCQTYLIFRSQPPYSNATSIAKHLSSDPSEVAKINNISETSPLVTGTEVIVPVTCSCAGEFYQSNTTYVVKTNDNPYLIATNIFEGLTTCHAIQNQRSRASQRFADIFPGERLTIPIRCACPTKEQATEGKKYLLTYIVRKGDTISTIALRFGADVGMTLEANNKSVKDSLIKPSTTLLVPVENPPNSNQTEKPEPSSPPPSPPPASSTPSGDDNRSSREKWIYLVAGLIGGAVFMLLIGAIFFCWFKRRTKEKTKMAESSKRLEAQGKPLETKNIESTLDLESIPSMVKSLKVYGIKDLESATDNFSSSSWIRGSVYMGMINGTKVAIKRKDAGVEREIEILNKVNHFNLISLLGVSYNDGQWYLIYEYASNGSLSDWIFQKDANSPGQTHGRMFLTWVQRIQISLDVATGLDYLHCCTSPSQVHKDLKCSHVLLNEEFRAKISHFGLSKSVGRGREAGQFALTEHIIGTKGYMAPEYLENGLVTTKLDVYAFGVLLTEILTGKEMADLLSEENVCLSSILGPLIEDDGKDGMEKLRLFMDPRLNENYPMEVALMMVQLVERCVRKEPSARPGMEEIVRFLARTLTTTMILESSASFNISSETTSN